MSRKAGLFVSVVFCLSLFYQSYFVAREDFISLISCVSIDFICYLLLLKASFSEKEFRNLILLLLLIPFFAIPPLSNDFYRFLWDGEILQAGMNPYDFKPSEIINQTQGFTSLYSNQLYRGMGDLSQENYSCYPVFNQFYFYISTLFTNNILVNVFILRALILVSLFFGLHYLRLILQHLNMDVKNYLWFALNPLLLIEVSQNLHFEGVMLSFSLIAFYFICKKQFFGASLFFALAIQIKLIPLIFLPFLLRSLGWKMTLKTWTITGVFTILITLLLIYPSNYLNFLQSLSLYFRQFEFNSFILHYYIEYGRMMYGYNRIQTYGPYLSRLAIEAVIVLAWFGEFSMQKMFQRLFFAMLIYYFLSSTVHPWYILTPLLFGVFTCYKTAVFWSFMVFLSYYSYAFLDQNYFRTCVGIEYIAVFLFFIAEISIDLLNRVMDSKRK